MTDAQAWPSELRLHKDRKTLTVTFDGGESFDLPAEYLRVKSPSAEVQGHSAEERKTVPGKRDVGIIEVLPVGNYAVRLVFDDMHSTGIFGWDYLLELGRNYAAYWQDYLDELAAKNLTRDPPVRRYNVCKAMARRQTNRRRKTDLGPATFKLATVVVMFGCDRTKLALDNGVQLIDAADLGPLWQSVRRRLTLEIPAKERKLHGASIHDASVPLKRTLHAGVCHGIRHTGLIEIDYLPVRQREVGTALDDDNGEREAGRGIAGQKKVDNRASIPMVATGVLIV